jgi:putative ABC transport system permease protein
MTWSRLSRILKLRWRSLTRAERLDEELDRELAFHFDQLVREYVGEGLDPQDAALAARQALGNLTAAKERARDYRGVGWLNDLGRDIRYAARRLRNAPAFTAVAVGSLAFGLGTNAAVLSAIHSTLWRPMPLPNAERLMIVRTQSQVDGLEHDQSSLTEFLAWKQRAHTLESVVAAFSGERDVAADANGQPAVRFATRAVTPGWFQTLGVVPYLGRLFTDAEYGSRGSPDAVLISYDLWQTRYARDPGIIGRAIRVNGADTRVVGVMPRDFAYKTQLVHAWFPLHLDPEKTAATTRWFTVIALRRSGVSVQDVQTDLTAVSRTIADQLPKTVSWRPHVLPLSEAERAWATRPLWALEGTAALVLLIACANVAGLLLARNATRQHEFAVRAALGANRGRLTRQIMGETLLLALLASGGGLGVAWLVLRGLTGILSPPIGSSALLLGGPNPALIAIMIVLIAAVTATVGIVPGYLSTRASSVWSPSPGSPGRQTASRFKLRGFLVATQIAASIVLLVSAALVVQSFIRLTFRDLHFDQRRLVMFQFRATGPAPRPIVQRVFNALNDVPDTEAVAGISDWHLTTLIPQKANVRLADSTPRLPVTPRYFLVTPGFFAAMRTPILKGREFGAKDDDGTPWTVVVNRTAAELFWPESDPIGQQLTVENIAGERPREVIGVVADVPLHRADLRTTPMLYASYLQQPPYQLPAIGVGLAGRMTFVIRYRTNRDAVVLEAERRAAAVAPNLPLIYGGEVTDFDPPTLQFLNYAVTLTALAMLAVVLAVIGLYGVTSHAVSERTREIGIRRALGADRRTIVRLVARTTFAVVLVGVLTGIAGTLTLPGLIASRLWAVDPRNPITILGVVVVVLGTVLVAAWVPLRRATAVDPSITLRAE